MSNFSFNFCQNLHLFPTIIFHVMYLNKNTGAEWNLSESCKKFCKNRHIVWISPIVNTLITITFLKVLFIDYVLSKFENCYTELCGAHFKNCFCYFLFLHPISSAFKISGPPSHQLHFFFDPPFLKPKKMDPLLICPAHPTRVFMNTPLIFAMLWN